MSKIQTVRGFINQRLSAAAEEIFELFERTIAEYEEQLCRSKEENERQKRRLDAVYNPEVRLHRTDIQLLLVRTEKVPQEDLPEPPHVKDEEEDLWSHQETEQLHGLKEEETTEFLLTPVPAQTEEAGEEHQSSQLHVNQNKEILDSESETDDSNFHLEESSKPESGLNHVSNRGGKSVETVVSSSECATSSDQKETEGYATKIQNNKKTFSCSVCGKCFTTRSNLYRHQRTRRGGSGCMSGLNHLRKKAAGKNLESSSECASSSEQQTEPQKQDKPFCCPVCGKRYLTRVTLKQHMCCHSDEKPCSCTICGKRFLQRRYLQQHMVYHSGVKRYSCSQCDKKFLRPSRLKEHMTIHTGEKLFSCHVCGTKFVTKQSLKAHMVKHTAEKCYSCSLCGKKFSTTYLLKKHVAIHTGEKSHACSVCGKKFLLMRYLKQHMLCHLVVKPRISSNCGKGYLKPS